MYLRNVWRSRLDDDRFMVGRVERDSHTGVLNPSLSNVSYTTKQTRLAVNMLVPSLVANKLAGVALGR